MEFYLGDDFIEAHSMVTADYKTGVEMEPLVGVTKVQLNIWNIVKYKEKDEAGQYPSTVITNVRVTEKRKG